MKKWKERFSGLKLNTKFTIVILLLLIFPIAILAGVLFYNMEQNVISENMNYMQYTMQRNLDNVQKNVDAINMTTQFFLSDEALRTVLNASVTGEKMTTEQVLEFYGSEIAALERLVNNNPGIYGVRVYAVNEGVQEMMPILYRKSRMERQTWAAGEEAKELVGWKYGYQDRIFEGRGGDVPIAALITKMQDYENGCIGIVEAAITMPSMFPSLYENIEDEWSCFVEEEGGIYFGANEQETSLVFAREVIESGMEKEGIHTYYAKSKGQKRIVSYAYIKELGGTLISVQDITENIQQVYRMRNSFVVIMSLVLAGIVFLIHLIVKMLLKYLYEILKVIRKVQKGDLEVRLSDCGTDEMGELGTQINKMLDRIQNLMDESIKRELLVKDSEIRALQNQINAHFIYNVLESIKMMAEIDEEYAISDAITALGKLLRYSMRWVSSNVLVEEEIEYIKNYLALINLRFDYEIYLSMNIPPLLLRQEIPKMSLQPIIENAIYHGIEELAEDTNIYIKGSTQGEDCIIEITDAGRGMTQEQVEELRKKIAGKIETSGGSGNGIGLKNVQDRIQMSFGERYGIEVASKMNCYTKITVRIPLQFQGGEENEDSINSRR